MFQSRGFSFLCPDDCLPDLEEIEGQNVFYLNRRPLPPFLLPFPYVGYGVGLGVGAGVGAAVGSYEQHFFLLAHAMQRKEKQIELHGEKIKRDKSKECLLQHFESYTLLYHTYRVNFIQIVNIS